MDEAGYLLASYAKDRGGIVGGGGGEGGVVEDETGSYDQHDLSVWGGGEAEGEVRTPWWCWSVGMSARISREREKERRKDRTVVVVVVVVVLLSLSQF